MAEAVVAAAAPMPVTVVCDDEEVAGWAGGLGVVVEWTPGLGLDGAVEAAGPAGEEAGATAVVVAHADLPLARDLSPLAPPGERAPSAVTLVPDRHGDGTNVVVLPAGCGFRFAYGPGSFARHRAEAARLGLAVHVIHDLRLGWDVDLPADLELPSLPR
jgi:2-phospho-L-lactate guanylyltransferase